ncbi:MAG: glycoside hydrolase 5 family protein [Planctomycetaceae bacterium]
MEKERNFMLGANYWPGDKGLSWWREFELPTLRRDFSLAAEYGLGLIRIFLLWEDFQPEINRVSARALGDLVRTGDLAHDRRIKILPTLFCGHVSGINWLPPWMVEGGKSAYPLFSKGMIRKGRARNMYSDREVRKAQKLLIHETTGALQGHPAVWGWNLGNQTSKLVSPPSRDSARAWLEEMVTELGRWNSSLPITWAMDRSDLEEARVPSPRDLAPYCDFLSLEMQADQAAWADGPLDEKARLFLTLVTRWLGGKEVMAGDMGVPTEPLLPYLTEGDRKKLGKVGLIKESDAETFIEKTLGLLKENGVKGVLARSFSDYDSSLWDKPPLNERVAERFCGLFRRDGSAKPVARLIRDFPREGKPRDLSWDWVDMRPEEFGKDPAGHLPRLYRRFKDRFLP